MSKRNLHSEDLAVAAEGEVVAVEAVVTVVAAEVVPVVEDSLEEEIGVEEDVTDFPLHCLIDERNVLKCMMD